MTKIDSMKSGFLDVVDGLNCSLLISKGMTLILDTLCKTDPVNPTLMSGVLSVAF